MSFKHVVVDLSQLLNKYRKMLHEHFTTELLRKACLNFDDLIQAHIEYMFILGGSIENITSLHFEGVEGIADDDDVLEGLGQDKLMSLSSILYGLLDEVHGHLNNLGLQLDSNSLEYHIFDKWHSDVLYLRHMTADEKDHIFG